MAPGGEDPTPHIGGFPAGPFPGDERKIEAKGGGHLKGKNVPELFTGVGRSAQGAHDAVIVQGRVGIEKQVGEGFPDRGAALKFGGIKQRQHGGRAESEGRLCGI